jgi:hypothetical protein
MLKAKGLLNYLTSDKVDYEKAYQHIVKFALASDARAIKDFFEKCRLLKLNVMEMVYHTIVDLLKKGRDDLVSGLFSLSGEGDFLYGVYGIGQAFSHFKAFNAALGARLLGVSIYHCNNAFNSRNGGSLADIGFLSQNAFLLEGALWPSPKRFPEPLLEILSRNAFRDSPYTCVTVCDSKYFRHYAHGFVEGLRGACGRVSVFLLLVNPDEGIIADACGFDGATVAATRYNGTWIAEFSASARFILASGILDEIGGPALFLDIDSHFPKGSAEAFSIVAGKPLSVCDTGELFPFLRISAALLGLRPAPGTYEFLKALKDFLLEDMTREGPLWGMDQAALYRAVCLGKENGWGMSDINKDIEGLGRAPGMFVKPAGEVIPLEERRAIRTNSFYGLAGIESDGRLLFEPVGEMKAPGSKSAF